MKQKLRSILDYIVKDNYLHAKWLNTLSYLENCGARKIAACEHPTLVKEEVLKHASEEFRHSYYLKRQIKKISNSPFPDYSLHLIIGSTYSLNYLNKLDLLTSRFLIKEIGLDKQEAKKMAYLLVTYAIELRAHELYPIYEEALRACKSKIYVKSIILEEENHLREMKQGLDKIHLGLAYAKKVCMFEHILFEKWMNAVTNEARSDFQQILINPPKQGQEKLPNLKPNMLLKKRTSFMDKIEALLPKAPSLKDS